MDDFEVPHFRKPHVTVRPRPVESDCQPEVLIFSHDVRDHRDRHCQDGWEEQGPFLDLGGEVTMKMKLLLRPIPVDDSISFPGRVFP